MRYLSVIRKKSLTERNETDTCPLTDSKRVHVIDLDDFFVERFFLGWSSVNLTDTCNSGLIAAICVMSRQTNHSLDVIRESSY